MSYHKRRVGITHLPTRGSGLGETLRVSPHSGRSIPHLTTHLSLNRKHLSVWFPCSPVVHLTPIQPWINNIIAAAHRLFDQQSREEARLLVPSPTMAHYFHWISSNLEGIKEEQSGVMSFSLGNFPFISISYSTDCQGNHVEVFSHW